VSPGLRQHQVDHDIGQVDQDPLGLAIAFDAQRGDAGRLDPLDDTIGHGLDLAGRGATGNDHVVGEAAAVTQIDDLDVLTLGVFQYRLDKVLQFLRLDCGMFVQMPDLSVKVLSV
jgi:hypothetical protein